MSASVQLRDRARAGVGWRDHAIGAALCIAYIVLLWHTAGAIGMSRDEGIYVDAAQSYGAWFSQLAHDSQAALERPAIDRAFTVNHEHPPLMKMLFALGYLAQERWQCFATDSLSFRFAGMLSAGLLLWLIHVFGTRLYSRRAGLLAALLFALLPRPFYHSHLDAFDIPITLAVTAVTYAYWRSLSSKRWALLTGVNFGIALLTKHNAWILPGIFALHFVWMSIVERRARSIDASAPPARNLIPYWLLAMALLGPAIFVAGWPWLWHDTLRRLNSYAAFHLHHDYYNISYFGVNYFWPPFPISYPWVLTLFTVPLTTLVLAVVGLAEELRAAFIGLRALLTRTLDAASELDRSQVTVLLLGSLFAPLVIISLPSTPIFGGTKHWFPAYPFMVLFAGRAFDLALPKLAALLPERFAGLRTRIALPCALLLLAPAAVETAHSQPFGLSHYTAAAGGVPGAADLGMNRQFWGFTTRSVVPFLNEALPNGGRVYICDTVYAAFQMLQRDGLLAPNIRATGDIALADYALVHHELHFAEVDQQIWTTYGSVKPAYVLRYDGVPIVSVYRNPRSRK